MAYVIAFTGMGAFVTLFNYVGFHLMAAPYDLSQTAIGVIFVVYVFGILSSSLAGFATERLGRRVALPLGLALMAGGTALTILKPLAAVVAGIIVLTFGFFFAHAIASASVGLNARRSKGHAASLYHLSYYGGSSLAGWMGGWFLPLGGWPAVAAFTLALIAIGFVAALRLGAAEP
jgi:YNFM family putative membrane transporter